MHIFRLYIFILIIFNPENFDPWEPGYLFVPYLDVILRHVSIEQLMRFCR